MCPNIVASLETELQCTMKASPRMNDEISSHKTIETVSKWKSSKLKDLFNLCNHDVKEATGHYYPINFYQLA